MSLDLPKESSLQNYQASSQIFTLLSTESLVLLKQCPCIKHLLQILQMWPESPSPQFHLQSLTHPLLALHSCNASPRVGEQKCPPFNPQLNIQRFLYSRCPDCTAPFSSLHILGIYLTVYLQDSIYDVCRTKSFKYTMISQSLHLVLLSLPT